MAVGGAAAPELSGRAGAAPSRNHHRRDRSTTPAKPASVPNAKCVPAPFQARADTPPRPGGATGTTFPDAVLDAARAADGVLLGPVSHNEYPPVAQGGLNPSGQLRIRLDLYANGRPARSRPGFAPRCGKPLDLVVMRENTEGFYSDRSMHMGPGEMMPTPDLALSFRKVTRHASLRIAEAGFRRVNAMRLTGGVVAIHSAWKL